MTHVSVPHEPSASMTNASGFRTAVSSSDAPSRLKALLGLLDSQLTDQVAYDTAWLARLGAVDPVLSSGALEWLRAHQLPDGSWGAETPLYHHDRVICTLAAFIALRCNNAPEDQARIQMALPALHRSLASLHEDLAGKTVAFEMLLPSLVGEARALGLAVEDPDGILEEMSRLRDLKLAHAPRGLIDRHTTLGFSAEMVGAEGLHLLDTENLQQDDGSVSGSPAATAFFAAQVRPDPNALRYLHRVVQHGGAPHVTSSDIFEPAWALWNLTRGREIDAEVAEIGNALLDMLMGWWHPQRGIAHDTSYSVQDGDDTSIVYELLAQFNRAPDPAALWYYEGETHFRSFDLESHSSVSTNIHMLGALRRAGFPADHRAVQKIAAYLCRERIDQRFWVDKWHTSPYYPTCHAVMACAGYVDDIVGDSVQWLLSTQNEDGSWGSFLPTAEETAYCVQALMAWREQGRAIPLDALTRGVEWLAQHTAPPYPPLWIIKTLYCPTLVVRSAIVGALQQYAREIVPVR